MSLNIFPRPYAIPKNITRALLRLERTMNLLGGEGGREGGGCGGEREGVGERGSEGRKGGWGREGGEGGE